MKAWIICSVMIYILVMYPTSQAQENHNEHTHKNNEIGGALGMVFNLNEHYTASGFHIHYARMFGKKLHQFGVSPGVEFIFGEHQHYTLHLMFVYRPVYGWWIGAGPGMTYFEDLDDIGYSGHIETGYEFDAGTIHFGPVLEYTYTKEDQHIMIGLHLGVPF